MTDGLTVLVLGGYGTFGSRLVRRLAGTPRLSLIVAGRSAAKAEAFVASLPDRTGIRTAVIDRTGDLAEPLGRLRPALLVDATGPFQAGGPERYRVVEGCLALGIHYLDLADSLDFVLGIKGFETVAHAKSLVVLSGLSTLPALSGALVRALAEPFSRVEHVVVALAPSAFADIGLSAIQAVTTYAGRPIALLRHGRPARDFGLTDARRMTIAPPGRLPLRSRIISLVEVPDLRLMPERTPGLTSIWTGAGTAPPLLHRAMIGMAWLVRLGLLPSLAPFARLFWTVSKAVRWGENRGGLLVSVSGRLQDGTAAERSFHLVAEGADGPLIPCLAAEVVIRTALAGQWPEPGARPAIDAIELADLLPLLAQLRVSVGYRLRTRETATLPLYEQVLGESWATLPPAVRPARQHRYAAVRGRSQRRPGLRRPGPHPGDADRLPGGGEADPGFGRVRSCSRARDLAARLRGAALCQRAVGRTGSVRPSRNRAVRAGVGRPGAGHRRGSAADHRAALEHPGCATAALVGAGRQHVRERARRSFRVPRRDRDPDDRTDRALSRLAHPFERSGGANAASMRSAARATPPASAISRARF